MKRLEERSSHKHFSWNPNSMYLPPHTHQAGHKGSSSRHSSAHSVRSENTQGVMPVLPYIREIYFLYHETPQNTPNRAAHHTDPAIPTQVHFSSNSSHPRSGGYMWFTNPYETQVFMRFVIEGWSFQEKKNVQMLLKPSLNSLGKPPYKSKIIQPRTVHLTLSGYPVAVSIHFLTLKHYGSRPPLCLPPSQPSFVLLPIPVPNHIGPKFTTDHPKWAAGSVKHWREGTWLNYKKWKSRVRGTRAWHGA